MDVSNDTDKTQGKVKWFNNAKGFGFIKTDSLTEDIFAHFSQIEMHGYSTLKAGQTVLFYVEKTPTGFHAKNIIPVAETGT